MDKIFIRNLEVEAIIGIYDWEREVRQLISINLELSFDISKAGKSDNIKDALNYKEISKTIIKLVEGSKSKLLEHLVEKVAKTILENFPVSSVVVTAEKPGALRGSQSVGITIERS